MSVPNGWKAIGHRHKHALLLRNAAGIGTALVAEQARARKLRVFVEAMKSELRIKSKGGTWQTTKDGGWLLKQKDSSVQVLLHTQRVKAWNVAIHSTMNEDMSSAFSAFHSLVFSDLQIGWKRPRPTRMTIPGTLLDVRHPDGDWKVQAMDKNTIHWVNAAGTAGLQVGRFPMAGGDLRNALDHVTRGMAGTEGQWTWADPKSWKVPRRKGAGLFCRGEATLRRNRRDVRYRLDAFAFQDGEVAIVGMSTSRGEGNSSASKHLRKLMNSLRKQKR